jgi:hypothetical protein
VALGACAGLMMLSRTDTFVAVGVVLVALLVRDGRAGWSKPILSGAVATAFVLPWLLWSWLATGSFVPDSAVAGGHVVQEIYFSTHEDSFWPNLRHGLDFARFTLLEDLPRQNLVPTPSSSTPYWLAAAAVLALVALVPSSRRWETLRALGLIAVPLSGLLLMLAIGATVRWYAAGWYFAPYALFAALTLGVTAHWLEGLIDDVRSQITNSARSSSADAASTLLYAGLYSVLAIALAWHFSPSRFDGIWYSHAWQADQLEASSWVEEHTPPDTRIAAYNAGIFAYFTGRSVTNIDGVMNRDGYEALRDCRTREYLRAIGVDYVMDSRPMFMLTDCALSLDRDLVVETEIGTIQPIVIAELRRPDGP